MGVLESGRVQCPFCRIPQVPKEIPSGPNGCGTLSNPGGEGSENAASPDLPVRAWRAAHRLHRASPLRQTLPQAPELLRAVRLSDSSAGRQPRARRAASWTRAASTAALRPDLRQWIGAAPDGCHSAPGIGPATATRAGRGFAARSPAPEAATVKLGRVLGALGSGPASREGPISE